MPAAKLEHVNITVSNNAHSAQKLIDIFDWHIRWQGPSASGGNSIHVGSDAHYIALYTPPQKSGQPTKFAPTKFAPTKLTKGLPLNHVCVEVDDLAATEAKVVAAGLSPFNHGDYDPGRRFYFFDDDSIEYEVVSYV